MRAIMGALGTRENSGATNCAGQASFDVRRDRMQCGAPRTLGKARARRSRTPWTTVNQCKPFVTAFALARGWPSWRSSRWQLARRCRACACPRTAAACTKPVRCMSLPRRRRRRTRWARPITIKTGRCGPARCPLPRKHLRTTTHSSTAGSACSRRMPLPLRTLHPPLSRCANARA